MIAPRRQLAYPGWPPRPNRPALPVPPGIGPPALRNPQWAGPLARLPHRGDRPYHRGYSGPSPHHGSLPSALRSLFQHWTTGSIKKDPSSDDLFLLKDVKTKPARKDHHELTPDQAVKLVYENVRKLCEGASSTDGYGRRTISGEDLPFQIFNDIDKLLFGGVLKGNVCLQIKQRLGGGEDGACSRAGKDGPRIAITLSRGLIERTAGGKYGGRDPGFLVEVLLHQMTHAYLLQCCGFRDSAAEGNGCDLSHSPHFSMIASMFERTMLGGHMEFPALMGQSRRWSGTRGWHGQDGREAWDGRSLCDGRERGSGSRECERCLAQASRTEAKKLEMEKKCPKDNDGTPRAMTQYVHDLLPDLSYRAILRASYKEISPAYIELVFRSRAIAIPKSTLHNKALRALKDGGEVKINIPDDVAFALLHRCLTTGDYRVDLNRGAEFGKGIAGLAGAMGGLGFGGELGNDMLADVRIYRIGAHIDNPELQDLARLHLKDGWHRTRNPVPALDYAYHGPEVESDEDKKTMEKVWKDPPGSLREWVRCFLARRLDESDSSRHSLEGVLHGKRVRPMHVLDWLEESDLQHQWKKCKEQGGCLVSDVDWARTQIKACGVMGYGDRGTTARVSDYYDGGRKPREIGFAGIGDVAALDLLAGRGLEQRLAERKVDERRVMERLKEREVEELLKCKRRKELMRELEGMKMAYESPYQTRVPRWNC